MLKKLLLISAIGSFAFAQANAQLSLKEAIERAQTSSKSSKAANLSLESKSSAVKSAWGRFAPEIGVTATYTHLGDDLILDLDPIREAMIALQVENTVSLTDLSKGGHMTDVDKQKTRVAAKAKLENDLPHFQETLKEQNFPAAFVQVKQPIFTGGKIIAGVRAAEAQEDMAKEKYKQERENVSVEVIQRYLGLILAQENVKVRKDAFETINKHQARANRLMEEGVIASHDKLRADVALSEAQRNLYEAEEKLKLAKIALQSVLGGDTPAEIKDEMKATFLDLNTDAAVKKAREENPSLLQLRSVTKAFNEKANVEYAGYFPTVFGFGFYNVFDHYIIPKSEPKWGIGIGASLELFNGFRHHNNYESAMKEAEAIKVGAEEVERKVDLLARSQSLEVSLAQNRYQQLNSALEQAEENVRLNSKRYETGMGTSLEVIDANLALESIKLQKVKALNDYYLNLSSLCQTMGDIDKFVQFWSK